METATASSHYAHMTGRSPSIVAVTLLLLASCNATDAPVQSANQDARVASGAGADEAAAGTPAAEAPAPAPTASAQPAATDTADADVSPCLIQGGERIPANRLKAIGTEPFWGARIEGRCVTYSTPEDQNGTRIWTQFTGTAESGTWTGFLDNQGFVLRTRPEPGCSDGMSDNRFPIAVTLTVRGEERSGCAEPL